MSTAEPSTSTSLLILLKAGNDSAWAKFCSLYGPLVYGWARKAGLQDSDSADVAQDVFLSVANGMDTFRRDRSGDTLRGWLWIIARNCIRKHCNSKRLSAQAEGGTDARLQLEQVPEILESGIMPNETTTPIRLAKLALELIRSEFNERTWQAFWRMSVAGHSAAEIGFDLDLSDSAVRQAKYRVLCRLREVLDDI